ncbi:MAG: histidinol-phosphate transaminase [Candidatus Omnitrophota bacterium]
MKMMINLANRHILDLKTYQPGKPIEEVKRQLKLKRVIKLASNENSFGVSKKAIRAVKKALPRVNFYPDSNCFYLREKLAKKLNLRGENLIFGNGSDEIILMALRAFVAPGEEVIVARPTFLIYEQASKVAGAKVITVPMRGFRYDLKKMKEKITSKTKMIFIANPDNPTGSYVTKTEVNNFFKGLPRHVLVYFDEAYYEFAANIDYPQTQRLIKTISNIIITRSFSKAYGLSGLRIGYGIAPELIISTLNKVREPFNVNSLAQVAAQAALDDQDFIRKTLKLTKIGRRFLCAAFKELGLFYVPSAANFVLVNVGRDSTKIYNALLNKGIIVRDMKPWGLERFIRVTIGQEKQNKYFVRVLREVLGVTSKVS